MLDDEMIDPTGQPAGSPVEMVKEYGYCPFASTMMMAQMVAPGTRLAPGGPAAQPVVMPLYAPCVGPRCQLWHRSQMCSFKRMADDLKQLGDHLDSQKFRGA